MKYSGNGFTPCDAEANVIGSIGAALRPNGGSTCRTRRRCIRRYERELGANAVCGSPVREIRTLGSTGETSTRDQAGSGDVYDAKASTGRGPAKATVPRLVSTHHEVSQDWLVHFVEHRIGDRRIIRLIRKWLKAGVLEDGIVTVSDKGTGQGSVISPLLANVYLHYVFDLWAERWRRHEATGDMIIVRYADDIVVGFEHESDARRFWDAMRQRLEEFSLALHPDKTRLIEFGRHVADRRAQRGLGKPDTFKFLGFIFICGRSRKGKFLLKRKSRRDRMRAKLSEIKEGLRRGKHRAIPEQGRWLAQVIRGYFAYHAVPTNFPALSAFRHYVRRLWLRTLRRRSQKDRFSWERMTRLADDFLPQPKILHPWPSVRFAVTTQGGSRMP